MSVAQCISVVDGFHANSFHLVSSLCPWLFPRLCQLPQPVAYGQQLFSHSLVPHGLSQAGRN